jgi:hypothetical protein
MERREKMSEPTPTEQKPQVEEKPVFDINQWLQSRKKEPLSLSEAYLIRAMMREDRLERELMNKPQTKPEDIAKTLISTLKEEGIIGKQQPSTDDIIAKVVSALKEQGYLKKQEEMPQWALELQQQQKEILARLSTEEQKKRENEIIEKAQTPLKMEIATLQAKIDQLTKKEEPKPEKPPLKEVKETLKDITETAEMIGYQKSSPSSNPTQGYVDTSGQYKIPISGTVPASWVIIPSIVESVLNTIEKRAAKYIGPKLEEEKELIKLPTPPTPETPITPQQIPPPIETPTEELIKLPTPLPKPEATPQPPPPPAPEIPKPKKYACVCGQTFDTPIEKARHAKKCPEAKKQREKPPSGEKSE